MNPSIIDKIMVWLLLGSVVVGVPIFFAGAIWGLLVALGVLLPLKEAGSVAILGWVFLACFTSFTFSVIWLTVSFFVGHQDR